MDGRVSIEEERANPLVFVLVVCFASITWLGANSIWVSGWTLSEANCCTFRVELTVFTQTMPEGWNLGSVLDVVIQLSSVGPIIFMVLDRGFKLHIPHGVVIQIALFVCALGNIPETAWFFGSSHSIVILLTAFILGTINVGSDVIVMPYMIVFKKLYLPAYFVGAGLSAVIPSLLSIAQGASSYKCIYNNATQQSYPHFLSPRFTISTFYMILFCWSCLACVSFYLVNWQTVRLERWFPQTVPRLIHAQDIASTAREDSKPQARLYEYEPWRDAFVLISLIALGVQLNTIFPSLQSYASLPYSTNAYFWSLTLSALAQPCGALVAYFIKVNRTIYLIGLSIVCAICTLIFVVIAAQSPHPFLSQTTIGSVMSVLLAVLIQSIGCFLRTCLMEAYRDGRPQDRSRLVWAGCSLQGGSLIGTLAMYPLVNVWRLFHDAPSC
ncbi:Riboflavin transporter [Aphelenchoides besseyi]|nr:Riboflavin transporter [Aphelenchoides besseyi]